MAHSTTTRPVAMRPRKSARRPRVRSGTRSTLSSMLTLARWQLRQTWWLLIVIGVALLASVVLVCALPLYAQVSESAGLRHSLEADPHNLYLTIHATNPLFSGDAVDGVQQALTEQIQGTLGPLVSGQPDLSVQISTLSLSSTSFVRLIGADVSHARAHVKLLRGRLPARTSGDTVEFVATAQGQHDLHLRLGQVLRVSYNLVNPSNRTIAGSINLRVVGVMAQPDGNDLFWHGESFAPENFDAGLNTLTRYPVLVSNAELMNALEDLSQPAAQVNDGTQFSNPSDTFWYYRFDFSHVDINHLDSLAASMKSILTTIEHNPEAPPYVVDTTSSGPLSVFQDYANRVTVIGLPVLCLTFLIGGLALFFVALMTDLLVERQMAAITLLRSRGATARQVFGSLLCQSIVLGLVAFVPGPLLAILLAQMLALSTLLPVDRASIDLITADPARVAQGLAGRDAIVVGLAILAMIFSIWRVMRSNMLVMRRESARSTQQPFWMRFKLDIMAAVIALVGFGLSIYIASPGVLDLRTRTLILPLTTMIGLLFLLLGCLLLFLRFFPAVLRLGERWAGHNRGAAPLLALAQMARAPRQSLRMTLLFALAVAFALFTLIFGQTQSQRLPDLTAYQVGGDISGEIPILQQGLTWDQLQAYYRGIKGVTSVTLGYTQQVAGGSNQDVNIDLQVVDADTYANTVYWTEQNGSQPIRTLTGLLISRRAEAEKKNIIPAIIDDAAAQSLNVTVGQQFVLKDFHGPLTYQVVAIVHYIPTIYDSASNTGPDASIAHGGVLIDYTTDSVVALAVNQEGVSPTNVWIRTSSDPKLLASARSGLLTGIYQLVNPSDRRAIIQNLTSDPLYAAIVGILLIGAGVALLLGLLGNLLVSWLNARNRRTTFVILRALGCAPRQIASVLIWEQGIVYGFALLLGVLLSILFALIVLPAFIFSPLASGDAANASAESFYVAQSVPAIHIVIPPGPALSVLAALVATCVIALALMTRIVVQPQIGQMLRVDED
jgi:putative ABC transport system permease protein